MVQYILDMYALGLCIYVWLRIRVFTRDRYWNHLGRNETGVRIHVQPYHINGADPGAQRVVSENERQSQGKF